VLGGSLQEASVVAFDDQGIMPPEVSTPKQPLQRIIFRARYTDWPLLPVLSERGGQGC